MSSSYFRQPQKLKDDRNLWKEFFNAVSRLQNVVNPLETIEFKQYLRASNDRVLFFTQSSNTINTVVQDPSLKVFQLPREPDGQFLTAWYRFLDFQGGRANDYSGFDNHALLADGSPVRSSAHVENQASVSLNGIDDLLHVPHSNTINMQGLQTGFTIQCWINPTRTDLHGGKPRVIANKIDDSPTASQRGWSLWFDSSGTLFFSMKIANQIFARTATNSIQATGQWYLIQAGWSVALGQAIPLSVNGQVYDNEPHLSNIEPIFTSGDTGGSGTGALDLYIGGTNEAGVSKFAGRIADFRYWREKVVTNGEYQAFFSNKYTIENIVNVFIIGAANLPTEEEGAPHPDPGVPPPPPPPAPAPGSVFSYSAVGFSSNSFTVDKNFTSPGSTGGGGGQSGDIPQQFFEDFNDSQPYTLTSQDQISPNGKWKLVQLPGSGGFVRVEDFTPPGGVTHRLLRMRRGTAPGPTLETNTDKFTDVWVRCNIRTIEQLVEGGNNYAMCVFKRIDNNNYYATLLNPQGARLVKSVGGTFTTLATESNPSNSTIYPVGSQHSMIVESRLDGTSIRVIVNGTTRIDFPATFTTPADNVATALTPIAFRAPGSDITVDDVIARPVFGDGFQQDTYTLTTVNQKSPNERWIVQTAPAGNGVIRTFDHGVFADGGRVLNLNSGSTGGATMPTVLSTVIYTGVNAFTHLRTISQHQTGINNRAQFIFKWKDANNYYVIHLHPSGFRVRRIIGGTEELLVEGSGVTFNDNVTHWIQAVLNNSARDVWIFINGTLRYEEHGTDGWASEDNGVLAGIGNIGFRALRSNAIFDNVIVKAW